ncbi:carbohydrate ABC transporter permease [Pacificibacter marinus]|uniref:Lactose transport system permease protein LacF n=1 Tax=Pacificibacter marinus TaxID=658057 RepID=A0A1Y5SG31_9RHOB|nr:sugar ABC transporter permease [Pacificibacter marinus]SEK53213.1 carbohydrate ABC transporter membrane protein 1, CUT1 family [Pacificibacter marinus]SLN38785.1 Lactose transport system permease protein LacF [Pacificibacter marinus]
MNKQKLLGAAFISPALIAVIVFFLVPVILTVVFSFTNMSTSTGILGGEYQLTQSDLDDLSGAGVSDEAITLLQGAGYAMTDESLTAFETEFGKTRADELAQKFPDATFDSRRDMERALKELRTDPLRSTRERKAAAELFRQSILGQRYETKDDFANAVSALNISAADTQPLTEVAYTGWTFTTQNFELLWQLPATWRYAINTVIYVSLTLVFNVTLGLFLALSTFFLPDRIAQTFRTIWFLPRILPPVLYVMMWQWMTWDQGFISSLLAPLGVDRIDWMRHSAVHGWTVLVLINGFVGASLGMILFSSSLRAIPQTQFYAAQVDGAGRWQQIRYVILPQMRWPILFITSYQTLSLLTSFEYILLSTDGGPGRQTEVWALAAYHTALSNYGGNLEYGLGAAYALALVIIGIILSAIYLRFFNFRELVAKPRIEQ